MYRQHHKAYWDNTSPQVQIASGRELAQSLRKAALLATRRTAQLHWGLSVPNQRPLDEGAGERSRAGEQIQRMQQARGQGKGSWGRERGQQGGTELGPKGAWNSFSFLKRDLDTEAWKLERQKIELLLDLSWRYIQLQSSESKHQVNETKDHIPSISKVLLLFCFFFFFPCPFVLRFKTHPKELGPYSGVHEVVGLVGLRGFFCVLGVGEVASSWKEWSCH